MTRVVVSGLGIVSPVGCDVASFWQALISGQDSLREASTLPGKGIQVGEILGHDFMAGLPLSASVCDRNALFAVAAARQALVSAGLGDGLPHPERVGVILGNSAGGQSSTDEQYARFYAHKRPHPMTVAKVMVSSSASWVSMVSGATGPCFVTSSACASSNHAIGTALQFLRAGLADIIVAGGTEAPLTVGTLHAWDSMKIMSRTACRPFAAGRDGLVLAEGAGMIVLETEAHARSRGLTPTVEAAGFGCCADAGDIVAPNVDGMARAMNLALADAGVTAGDLAYINAHGTGTRANDRAETLALKQLFGDKPLPPTSSTKGVTGHSLGAVGAFEAIATVMAIENGMAPPTANFDAPDPECDFDCVPNEGRAMPIPVAMSNSFGFGGLNTALVFRSLR
ncbi:MAG TPA: beta-ketoacyl-[acyl-carrier-protein] synthase family protein [Bosea sp. (in: a-proteobacteria)]|jgi:nodulation protein E|uniref:beta-ketoacyl-[acyl-carrier-protein] synthase family protein n=1 Tax=Bosea sp. (in: a-proteobacteria) TaxID=1871050 RepID=UPI002E113FDA|nr:beta-ketoacyl-[acyl-carrier-protein] synthase family protein [Bosea sp. (in: a-proteobacteria)]